MTPLTLMGVLLAAAYAMIRRWERLQRRDGMREPEQELQRPPAKRAPWWGDSSAVPRRPRRWGQTF